MENSKIKDWISTILKEKVVSLEFPDSNIVARCQCIKRIALVVLEGGRELTIFLKHFDLEEKYSYNSCSERIFGENPAEDLVVLHNWSQGLEAEFYTFIIKNSETIKNVPKCFGILDKNLIAIEDLTKKYSCLKMMNPKLEKDEVSKLLDAYSVFHLSSVPLLEVMKNELKSHSFYCGLRDKRVAYCSKSAGKSLNERLEEILESYEFSEYTKHNLISVMKNGLSKLSLLYSNYITILQGDANPNNIFVDHSISNTIFIDFQEGGYGNPMSDISWFLLTSNELSKEELLFCLKDYISKLTNDEEVAIQLLNDFFVGVLSSSYLIINALGVIPLNDRAVSWYGRLALSCVEKLNLFDQEISKAIADLKNN